MTRKFPIIALPLLGLTLAACSDAPYTPILDGPRNAQFQSDLDACRQVSQQRQSDGTATTGGAIVGGLVGGAEADDGDELGGVVAGAVIGGLLGSAEENAETEEARDEIVFNCMRGRGHNVVG